MSQNQSGRAPQPHQAHAPTPEDAARDKARSKIFSAKRDRVVVELFGVELEILQPSVGDVVTTAEASPQSMVVQLLLQNAFLPGTNVRVFDDADLDSMMSRPFGKEFREASRVMNEMMGIVPEEVAEAKGNSEKTH